MQTDFLFVGLTRSIILQKSKCQNKAHFMDDAFLKTRGIRYSNVESWFLFAPPYQNFWLRTRPGHP